MRLNGIQAEPGTIVGVHAGTQRLLVIRSSHPLVIPPHTLSSWVSVDFATAEEVTPEQFMREPRSVVEHRAIRRRMSCYGLIRQFKPSPRARVEIEFPIPQSTNRATRRSAEYRRHLKYVHELHGRHRS